LCLIVLSPSMTCGLSACRSLYARWPRLRPSSASPCARVRRPHAAGLARCFRDFDWLWNLGHAFHAMLAFSPGIPSAYNIALTGLSLVAAIFLTGAGLAVAVESIAGAGAWSAAALRRCTTLAWRRWRSRGGSFGIRSYIRSSVTSLSGTKPYFFKSLRMSFSAARLFLCSGLTDPATNTMMSPSRRANLPAMP
jgi:Bacterial signalling protein N terminal repeat